MNKENVIYIISDGTGETATTMIRAALVQYADIEVDIIRCKNIRTEEQIDSLIDQVHSRQGIVVHTVVSDSLREKIQESCASKVIQNVDLLGPILNELNIYFDDKNSKKTAGLLRSVDERYFKRIEAIEYTVKQDDGKLLDDLDNADIILVGISRTSKTPLSIFLSHKGWKVANIPLVLNQPLPEELFSVDQKKVVGLIIDTDNLRRIRRKRLEKFGQDPGSEYASLNHISKEIDYAMDTYKKNRRWPIFNVTDRALEETASEIIKIVASRQGIPFGVIL